MSRFLTTLRQQPLTVANFVVQRRVGHPAARELIGELVARTRPRPNWAGLPQETELDRRGYAPLDIVGPRKAAEMKDWLEQHDVYDFYGHTPGRFDVRNAGPETHVANLDDAVTLRAPHALAIANDPTVIGMVSRALGAKPLIVSMSSWWSLPHAGAAREAELFHRDVDDWRFIKLFVYLTDVDLDSGPHVYVPGSHRSNLLRPIRRYSEEQVEAAYPGTAITITGAAGSAFLENTQGLHRGVPPSKRRRLLYQVMYGLCRNPYGPPKPIGDRSEFPELELDPYINSVYLA